MNKLEEYREKQHPYFKAGFGAAIALDLPVKFAKWLKTLDNGTEGFDHHSKQVIPSIGFSPYDCFTEDLKTEGELYQYWLENIYKFE